MSEPSGTIIDSDGKPELSSAGDGSSDTESRPSGTQGNGPDNPAVDNQFASYSPATERIGASVGSGEPRRTKRGGIDKRTRAGRVASIDNGTPEAAPSRPLVSLTDAIISLHDMAAGVFEIEELELSEIEAAKYSNAIQDVSKYYMSAFDPKKVAIFNLTAIMGGIYGTRLMAYRRRRANEKRAKGTTEIHVAAPARPKTSAASNKEQNIPLEGLSPSQIWSEGG